jgi:predicted dithiol-disulfide oxidoreductase (DUF899 family)
VGASTNLSLKGSQTLTRQKKQFKSPSDEHATKNVSANCPEGRWLVRRISKTNSGGRTINYHQRQNMSTTTLTSEGRSPISEHPIISPEQWIPLRRELLKKEKELTRLRDRLNAELRQLPWVRLDENYLFDAPDGKVSLRDLFGGRSQLVIYHFMFGPDWQEGCPSCSFTSDHLDGALVHLAARDVTMVMVSRAPLAKIEAFKKRMGWHFDWVSSYGSKFNADFHTSFTKDEMAQGKVNYNYTMQPFPSEEAPGISVFYQDAVGTVFHTYSTYGRGVEQVVGTYMILDMVPKGRDEDLLGFTMEWVRHHDRYGSDVFADSTKPYWPATSSSAGCSCESAEARP